MSTTLLTVHDLRLLVSRLEAEDSRVKFDERRCGDDCQMKASQEGGITLHQKLSMLRIQTDCSKATMPFQRADSVTSTSIGHGEEDGTSGLSAEDVRSRAT